MVMARLSKNEIEVLESDVKFMLSKILFIKGKQDTEYESYIQKLFFLHEATGRTGYLINICRAEKKMYGFTTRARHAAAKAFSINQNELSLIFLLDSHTANAQIDRVCNILDKTFVKINRKNSNLNTIKNIYYAGVCNRIGHYSKSNQLIKKFKDEYDGKVLWQSQSLIDDPSLGERDIKFIENDLDLYVVKAKEKIRYAISISCNQNYFDLYAQIFVDSVKALCKGDAHLHFTFVNMVREKTLNKLDEWCSNISYSCTFLDVPLEKEIPVSAVARMALLNKLLTRFSVPVFYCEIDSVLINDLGYWIDTLISNSADHVVRSIGMLMPWQMYTCGFGLINNSDAGIRLAGLIENFSKGIYNTNDRLLWADQAILEGAIRFSSLRRDGYKKIEPSLKIVNKFVLTPTGGPERKLEYLKKAASKRVALQVIGLQRSGTNFLTEVLKACGSDFKVIESGDNTYAWKHALPSEQKSTTNKNISVIDSVYSNPDLKIVLLSKNPIAWIESITKRNPADLVKHRSFLLNSIENIDPILSLRFYLDYYGSWFASLEPDKFIHLRYEDLLSNFGATIANVSDKWSLHLNADIDLDKINVKYSKGNFSEKRDLYSRDFNKINFDFKDDLSAMLSEDDIKLLSFMGYNLV